MRVLKKPRVKFHAGDGVNLGKLVQEVLTMCRLGLVTTTRARLAETSAHIAGGEAMDISWETD